MSFWPTYKYPFNINPVASSGSSIALFRAPQTQSYPVSCSGAVLGTASPIDIRTPLDNMGELFRFPRRFGEDDFTYLGRIQRGLLVACNGTISGSEGHHLRLVSSFLGRSTISSPWDGITGSSLPNDTTYLDIVGDAGLQQTTTQYSLVDRQIIPILTTTSSVSSSLSAIKSTGVYTTPLTSLMIKYSSIIGPASGSYCSVFKCPIDLTSYHYVQIYIGNRYLWQGRDYLISAEDPSVIFFRRPLALSPMADLNILVRYYEPVRITYSQDALVNGAWEAWGLGRSNRTLGMESLSSTYNRLCAFGDTGLFSGGTVFSSSQAINPFTVNTLIPLPARYVASSQTLPTRILYFGKTIRTQSLPKVEKRLARLGGGSILTSLGMAVLTSHNTYTSWSALPVATNHQYGPPLDLDSTSITNSILSDGSYSPSFPFVVS